MSIIVLLIVCGFVVAQLVRLWRDEQITEGLRDRVDGWLDPKSMGSRRAGAQLWLADLLECPWCLSGWLSVFVVVGVDLLTDYQVPVPFIFWTVRS
jgi:hypothetical protein